MRYDGSDCMSAMNIHNYSCLINQVDTFSADAAVIILSNEFQLEFRSSLHYISINLALEKNKGNGSRKVSNIHELFYNKINSKILYQLDNNKALSSFLIRGCDNFT